MLWGHCVQYCIPTGHDFYDNILFKAIYGFHMPFFMLISGYLFYFSFRKRELAPLLAHRTQNLLHAILGGTVFIYLSTRYVSAVLDGQYLAVISGGWLESLNVVWFLWSVLSASLVVGFVCKKVARLRFQLLLLVVLGIPAVLLFPCGVENVFMFPYFVLGFFFAKYKDRIPQKLLLFKYVSIPAYPVLLLFFKRKHYIYTSGLWGAGNSLGESLSIDLYRWVVGLVGSVAAFCVLELFCRLVVRKTSDAPLWRHAARFGSASLQIYVLSIVFLSSYLPHAYRIVKRLVPALDSFFASYIWIYNGVFTLIVSTLYAIALFLIVKLFEKIKLSRLLFGR